MLIIGGTGFAVGRNNGGSATVGMQLFLLTWLLGMVSYTLYGIGVLEALNIHDWVGTWSASLTG